MNALSEYQRGEKNLLIPYLSIKDEKNLLMPYLSIKDEKKLLMPYLSIKGEKKLREITVNALSEYQRREKIVKMPYQSIIDAGKPVHLCSLTIIILPSTIAMVSMSEISRFKLRPPYKNV